MTLKSLRGIAAAFVIAGLAGTVGAASIGTAHAAGVRPAVGKPLQDAIDLAKSGKSREAMAKLHEAEGVKDLTADEKKVISQTEEYIAVKTGNFSGGVNSATAAKAKFAADYNARKYHDVIGADQDFLRKYGALDFQSQLIVAQAYYQSGDYKGAMAYLGHLGDSDDVLTLKMAAAAKLGDDAAQSQAAEKLVLSGKAQFWTYLFAAADRSSGLSDEQTLELFRLRLLTGNMRGADDYSAATELAIQLGYPQEGLAIGQKGFDAQVLTGARAQRLLALAKQRAVAQQAQMAAMAKDAAAAKSGDASVHLAEVYWGLGQYQQALDAAQAGIAKGVKKDPDGAQIVQAMAMIGLDKTRDAARDLAKLAKTASPTDKAVANLWSVYARAPKPQPAKTAETKSRRRK